MQILTAPPRDTLTAAQVRGLLTSDTVEISAGLELLDTSNRLVDDISDDLAGGNLTRDNYATVHGSCRLTIMRELTWGKDRVRPYMTLTDGAVSARFNLGVYVLTTPDTRRGEDVTSYDVTGYDLLHLLQDGPADTYVVTAGTTYVQAVRDVVTTSGIGATVLLDGTLQDTTVPYTMVWALTMDGGASWLRIINDLLGAINYNGIHADENGTLRSEPFMDVSTRPVDWTLDTTDDATNIVGEDRTLSMDTWGAPNYWRFVRSRMDPTPIEGDGMYTVENTTDGPTSQTALGRVVRKVVFLDAADQATLVAQGDRIVAEDRQVTRTFDLVIDPLPCMGHRDVFTLIDAGASDKLEGSSWVLNLDGTPGRLSLAAGKSTQADPVETQATATVTSAAPLQVVVDGAATDSFANALDAATYSVGQRVQVTIRNPRPPLVQGEES